MSCLTSFLNYYYFIIFPFLAKWNILEVHKITYSFSFSDNFVHEYE